MKKEEIKKSDSVEQKEKKKDDKDISAQRDPDKNDSPK
nr:3-methyladenine DNA glycosylase [Bacillus massiliglaciei]